MLGEQGEQRLMDLTASQPLPACKHVLKRVHLELDTVVPEAPREHRRQRPPRVGRIEQQPELAQGNDALGRDVRWLAFLRRNPEVGLAQSGFNVDVRPRSARSDEDMAHCLLYLRRNRRDAPRELSFQVAYVIVNPLRHKVLLKLTGERLTRASGRLDEDEISHCPEQRSRHSFRRAVETVLHTRYAADFSVGSGSAKCANSVFHTASPPVRWRARGNPWTADTRRGTRL